MVASTSHGSRFAALGRYLARGRGVDRADAGQGERVAWIAVRHLPTADPELAAKYMQASAAANTRVEKPVYHVALAFDPADPMTPVVMRRAAERLLEDLGLAEHQAVLVAHRDRAHPHVHLMVNRVHPRTGRAWDDAWDYRRIEASLRVQEQALGLRVVEGRHAPVVGVNPGRRPAELDDPDRARHAGPSAARYAGHGEQVSPTTKGELRQTLRTAELALIDRVRPQVDAFRRSATWDELAVHLAAHNLRLERKGQGLVVTDGVTAVKASRIARDCSLAQLEARIGGTYDTWLVRRTQGRDDPQHRELDDARRETTGPDRKRQTAPPSRTNEVPVATSITPVPELPETARPRFDPDELRRLTRVLAHTERTLDDPNRVNPELARPLAEQGTGARFVARRLEQYEQVLQAGIDAATARETFERARDTVRDAVSAGRAAAGAEGRFQEALASVYRDPRTARQEFDSATAQVGIERATDMLRRTPEIYGKLDASVVTERKLFATTAREDDRVARAGAVLAADLAGQAGVTRAAAAAPETLAKLMNSMHRAEAQAVQAEQTLAALPRGDELARSVARGVSRLDDRAFAEVKAALPVARAEMADAFRDATVQALARGSAGRVQHLREHLAERAGMSLPGASAPTASQRENAAALHQESARTLMEGRELARTLGVTSTPEPGLPQRDAVRVAGRDGTAPNGVARAHPVGENAVRPRDVATPRERGAAADLAGRAVHQAVQALAPEEVQALVTAVRVGAQMAAGLGKLVAKDLASVQGAVRTGVSAALVQREVER